MGPQVSRNRVDNSIDSNSIDGEAARPGLGAGQLTPREREVLAAVISGASNKEAGRRLGISPRTVEVHRARIMAKLGAKNTADLVRITLNIGRA
jgi:two-component system, LuxR family, response regulator FixJ